MYYLTLNTPLIREDGIEIQRMIEVLMEPCTLQVRYMPEGFSYYCSMYSSLMAYSFKP